MNPLLQPGLHNAFVADGFAAQPGSVSRSETKLLQGVHLAVKDVFDVVGLVSAVGNPCWASSQPIARYNASVVEQLLEAGCKWIGKTVTDELTYSLAGANVHYGTPVNPRAPDRLPGGSSSGSAVAVAAGHAQLALGTDCGGSVRLPASYCGIWGMRPTHGRIATSGCFTLAHSLDTVGWFAEHGELLEQTFGLLSHSEKADADPGITLLVSVDVLEQLDPPVRELFERWLEQCDLPIERLPLGTFALEEWAHAFRVIQGAEVWQQHRSWVSTHDPKFGIDVAQRFEAAAHIQPSMVAAAATTRSAACAYMSRLLCRGRLLVMPPVPGVAPLLGDPPAIVQDARERSQRLLCIAGLCGLPQVVMPWCTVDAAPVGLSLIGQRFADEQVLACALTLHHQSTAAKAENSYVPCS
ncbi:amidase [Pseudomonas sp. LS-2]|uniref:amidase n=1 Tax=Pseudomonas sp. LS-2 TaxID=2315859 RepID=UPI000E708229|nr:amidase [Pseudomonas sp. LS-2]RJX77842.1 amidase [Pseudomonas sp. LS-2]